MAGTSAAFAFAEPPLVLDWPLPLGPAGGLPLVPLCTVDAVAPPAEPASAGC